MTSEIYRKLNYNKIYLFNKLNIKCKKKKIITISTRHETSLN